MHWKGLLFRLQERQMKNVILYFVTESVRGILDMASYLIQTMALRYVEEPYFVMAPFISRVCSSDSRE